MPENLGQTQKNKMGLTYPGGGVTSYVQRLSYLLVSGLKCKF